VKEKLPINEKGDKKSQSNLSTSRYTPQNKALSKSIPKTRVSE